MAWLLALLQTLLFVFAAPMLAGWLKRIKCRLQNRKAPSVLQPYRDLLKLYRKQPIVPRSASWIFRAAPYIVFASTVLAAAFVPLVAVNLPTARIA
ncbi:MAG: hydrogenase subunit, partial [Proteobacteria bacterium]|nr:hydrogenase subunit [Pseudomonadota bacterium]